MSLSPRILADALFSPAESIRAVFEKTRYLLCDWNFTLYLGNQPMPYAPEFLKSISKSHQLIIATNSGFYPSYYANRIKKMAGKRWPALQIHNPVSRIELFLREQISKNPEFKFRVCMTAKKSGYWQSRLGEYLLHSDVNHPSEHWRHVIFNPSMPPHDSYQSSDAQISKLARLLRERPDAVLLCFSPAEDGRILAKLKKMVPHPIHRQFFGKHQASFYTDFLKRNPSVKPEDCLMIGDSYHYDIVPAAAQRFNTLWVNKGSNPADFPGLRVPNFKTLYEALNGLKESEPPSVF